MRISHYLAPALAALLLAVACSPAPRYQITSGHSDDPSRAGLIVLRDEEGGLEAAIAPEKGGEMCSLRVRFGGDWIETLYLARDYSPREGWTGKAPLLWPATGRNFPPDLEERQKAGERFSEGAYEHQGQRYPMPIHGFARDLPWEVVSQSAGEDGARAVLALEDSPQTREWYPFGFRLTAEYLLAGGQMRIHYRVAAKQENEEAMFFSIGNHITFNTPLVPGSDPAKVLFRTPSSEELLKTDYGIPTGESRPRSHAEGIELGEFERRSAVSLTGYPPGAAPYIELEDPAGLTLRMENEPQSVPEHPVVLFNVWGDATDGYFSPEPWVGLQDSFVLRKGLLYLAPGETYDWEIRIRFEH